MILYCCCWAICFLLFLWYKLIRPNAKRKRELAAISKIIKPARDSLKKFLACCSPCEEFHACMFLLYPFPINNYTFVWAPRYTTIGSLESREHTIKWTARAKLFSLSDLAVFLIASCLSTHSIIFWCEYMWCVHRRIACWWFYCPTGMMANQEMEARKLKNICPMLFSCNSLNIIEIFWSFRGNKAYYRSHSLTGYIRDEIKSPK